MCNSIDSVRKKSCLPVCTTVRGHLRYSSVISKSYVSLFYRRYCYNMKIYSIIMCLFTVTLCECSSSYLFTKTDITEIHGMKFFFCFSFILNKDNFLFSCSGVLHLYLLLKVRTIILSAITTVQPKPEAVSSVLPYTKRNNRSGTTQFYTPFHASVHEYR